MTPKDTKINLDEQIVSSWDLETNQELTEKIPFCATLYCLESKNLASN